MKLFRQESCLINIVENQMLSSFLSKRSNYSVGSVFDIDLKIKRAHIFN